MDVSILLTLLCLTLLTVSVTVAATRRYGVRQRVADDGRHIALVRLAADDWMLVYAIPGKPRQVTHFAHAFDAHRGYLEALAGIDPTPPLGGGPCWEHLWGISEPPAGPSLLINNPIPGNLAALRMEERHTFVTSPQAFLTIPPTA